MTDMELLARSLRGDEAAFQTLYERHASAVFRFAWIFMNSHADAEDITQESFLVIMRRAAAFDPDKAQFRTWMLSVTRHLCLQHKQRNCRAEQLEIEPHSQTASVEQAVIREEVEAAVRRAVGVLPEAQREAIFLFEFEGLSLKEVSAVLEIDTNAVKARLHRGREQLKRSLAELKPEIKGTRRSES
jgi:RNA polymerase sigma-70 factor (ECF subfamily)